LQHYSLKKKIIMQKSPLICTLLSKKTRRFLAFFMLFMPFFIHAQTADMTGTWVFSLGENDIVQRVKITQEKDSFRGVFFGQAFKNRLSKDKITFTLGDFEYQGQRLNNDRIEGSFTLKKEQKNVWLAQKEVPERAGKLFNFSPTSFSRHFTANRPPALKLFSGDTVVTKTIDASGTDEKSKQINWGGNPLTGPFYIENTIQGDVLAVTFLKVETNRGWAFSGRHIVDNVLETNYLLNRQKDRIDNAWTIDKVQKHLKMENPTEKLKDFRIPLTPFLGCAGVAPPNGTTLRTWDSGIYGGNMEYKYITEGTTLFLPIYTEGGYLYLGDGHAAQGDGELAGNALETSLDVSFTLKVLKGKGQNIPRAENSDYLMSIGIANSLDEAIKTATTDMVRWLETEYQLTASETAMIVGSVIQFDIPDMVAPNISVVARLGKKYLEGIVRK
jgi:amidase